MILRKVEEKDFELICKMDWEMYPTGTPPSGEIFKEWYIGENKLTEFGMIYEDSKGEILGFAVILPLTKERWNFICTGKAWSTDSKSSDLVLKNSKEKEVGLHVYHSNFSFINHSS